MTNEQEIRHAKILMAYANGMNYREIGVDENICSGRVRQIVYKSMRLFMPGMLTHYWNVDGMNLSRFIRDNQFQIVRKCLKIIKLGNEHKTLKQKFEVIPE